MSKQVCAVCGQGGYWVGFDPAAGEDRCINHLARDEGDENGTDT